MIEILDVKFHYEGSPSNVLDGVSLSVHDGEMVSVVGHNGSGKSTLAKLINGLLLPDSGSITVSGLCTSNEKNLLPIRQKVGIIFQNPDNQLVTTIVEEDVAFGPENLGIVPAEIRSRVDRALRDVGMESYANSSSHSLSGGQKQRIAIAGMLAMEPEILIMDESTSMLDPKGRNEVLEIIDRLHRENGMTVIMITQYMEETVSSDRVVVLEHGKIRMEGTPKDVFRKADELREIGLDVPECVWLREKLNRSGIVLENDPITLEETAEEICRSYSKM